MHSASHTKGGVGSVGDRCGVLLDVGEWVCGRMSRTGQTNGVLTDKWEENNLQSGLSSLCYS